MRRCISGHSLVVAAAAAVITTSSGVARAQPEGCGKDTDCKFDRVCREGRCVDVPPAPPPSPAYAPPPGPPPPIPKHRPWRSQRLGIYYLGMLPVAGVNRPPEVAHSVGLQDASRIFEELRFHFAIGYQAQPTAGNTQHGLRTEIIGLGYTFTVLDGKDVQLGIEPVLHVFTLEGYFPTGNLGAELDLGSGWGVLGIFGFGNRHGFLALEPIGMNMRWLRTGDDIPTTAGLGVSWRLRAAVGLAF